MIRVVNCTKHAGSSGQIALITVLTSVVVFTVGVATASRMTSDIRIATRVEEAAQADAVAEAGIEEGLLAVKNHETNPVVFDTPGPLIPIGSPVLGSYQKIMHRLPRTTPYSLGQITPGDVASIWLTNKPNNPLDNSAVSYEGEYILSWEPTLANIEITAYYKNTATGTTIETKRWHQTSSSPIEFDFDRSSATPALGSNGFGILMRIRPINEPVIATVTIPAADFAQFPIQGFQIEVISSTPQQEVQRKIIFDKWLEDFPTFFDFVLYSEGTVENQ